LDSLTVSPGVSQISLSEMMATGKPKLTLKCLIRISNTHTLYSGSNISFAQRSSQC